MSRSSMVVAALLGIACGGSPDGMDGKKKEKVEPVTVVEVRAVLTGEVSDLLVTSATVESERTADVVPQATGIVREVRASEGDTVQKGQVLAIVENVSLDEGAARARADLARLEDQLAGTRRLYDRGAVSKADLDQIEFQVRTARSSLREATTTEGNTRIVAPFEGVVASRDIRVGQLAAASSRAFQVVDLGALRVAAGLPERDVGRVRLGQTARLVSAYDDSLVVDAVVARLSPVIDAQTGTFKVILELPSEQRTLRPGQYVNVSLQVDVHRDVLVVPREAVVYEDGVPLVYRMVPRPPESEKPKEEAAEAQPDRGFGFSFSGLGGGGEGPEEEEKKELSPYIAKRTPVRVGLTDDKVAEILEGLSLSDEVVVVGQSNLKDGVSVKTADMVRKDAEAAAKEPQITDGEGG